MIQSNPLQSKEKSSSDVQFQRKFLGVIAISVLALLAYSYVLSNLFRLEPTTAVYIKMAVYVIAIVLSVTSFILAIRRQVDLALTTIFYYLLIALVAGPTTTQGRTLNSTFAMLVVGVVMIRWLLPQSSRRKNAAYLAGAFALAWVVEWINPPWRIVTNAAVIGPVVAIIFSVILVALVAREAWVRSMRNKLMVAFIGVTLVAAAALAVYVYVSTDSILRNGLEGELTQHTEGVAASIGSLLDSQINTMTTLSLNESIQQAVEDAKNAYTGDTISIQTTLDVLDTKWRAADAADNDHDPLVREHLTNPVALELLEFQRSFPNNAEVFVTDVYGGLVGATNRTSDFYQADEGWWQAAYNNGDGAVYISDPEFDESANALAVLIALPLRNRETGEIVGVLRTTYLVSALNTILSKEVGKTGQTDIFFPGEVTYHFHDGQYIPVSLEEYQVFQAVANQGMVEMNYEDTPSVVLQTPMKSSEGNQAVENLGWIILFHQQQDEAFAPVNSQIRGTLVVSGIILLLAIVAAFGLSLYLVHPITQLTQTAEEVAAGNLNSRAQVTGNDEIGTLATTFNSMTSQLQETLRGLEHRVIARTRDLAIVAEVGTATASILESKRLLQEVVDLTKERFNLYHSHIYLLDEKGENLVLMAGAGEPGRIMVAEGRSIPMDREQSLVARAAREQQGVTANDVTQTPDHLPNPLLPETRSELAVPMIIGGNVIGVFDIQSKQVGRFTETDINIQTTLAAQLATSIQNVRSFERSKKEAELQSLVNLIGSRIQRTTTIEETLQTAIRELGTAIGASRVKAKIESDSKAVSTGPAAAD